VRSGCCVVQPELYIKYMGVAGVAQLLQVCVAWG
jgi:hypothetical protein